MMVLWAGAMLLAGAGAMAAPVATVAGGVGLAELVHIEAGWLPREDLAVELHAGTVVFNVLVGPAVTWTALGEPRGHQMLLTGALRVNPLVSPFTLKSGGESLAATGETYLGYGFVGERGLLLRARAGVLMYGDGGFAAGPNVGLMAGYAFGS